MCAKRAGGRGIGAGGGDTPDMKVVSLLICWSLPLLAIGGSGQAPPLSAGATADADMQLTPAMIQRPIETDFPGDLGKVTLGSSCWDEEDSLDDHSHGWRTLARASPLGLRERSPLLVCSPAVRSCSISLPHSPPPLLSAKHPAVVAVSVLPGCCLEIDGPASPECLGVMHLGALIR